LFSVIMCIYVYMCLVCAALDALQRSQNEMRANSLKMQQKSFMFLKTMDAVSKASREFESENQRLFWFPRVADEWTQNLEFVAAVLDKMVLKYHVEADAGLEGPVEQSIE
jgi:hypothetical protein